HLHLTRHGLELPDAILSRWRRKMKKLMLLVMVAVLASNLAGCSSCRRGWFSGWFNRGDQCDHFVPDDCHPGVPQATMMVPGPVMPGPIEIAPAG
ncbi:MAG TPA: hypothetical protein VFV87_23110, partial [Pirellulaceae bacterium]|nr:hypothetical protein [Pirellulaceae bacterium]